MDQFERLRDVQPYFGWAFTLLKRGSECLHLVSQISTVKVNIEKNTKVLYWTVLRPVVKICYTVYSVRTCSLRRLTIVEEHF